MRLEVYFPYTADKAEYWRRANLLKELGFKTEKRLIRAFRNDQLLTIWCREAEPEEVKEIRQNLKYLSDRLKVYPT